MGAQAPRETGSGAGRLGTSGDKEAGWGAGGGVFPECVSTKALTWSRNPGLEPPEPP